MQILGRLFGGIIGGAGAYAGLVLFAPHLGLPVIAGVTAVMAVLGLVFGPKIWEVVVHLF